MADDEKKVTICNQNLFGFHNIPIAKSVHMFRKKFKTKTPYPIKMKYSVIAKIFGYFIFRSGRFGSPDSDYSAAGFGCSDGSAADPVRSVYSAADGYFD